VLTSLKSFRVEVFHHEAIEKCMNTEKSDLPTDEELKEKLTEEQYLVCQCSATERAFTGKYWDCKTDGVYQCVCCGADLFSSETKFDSGSGWPSYYAPISEDAVGEKKDMSHGMIRVEIVCNHCGSHLGHVFPDGPPPTGLRYCVNSASLNLEPKEA
jgi:peptide-methionine (R)-S-oxide reductase